MMKKALQAVAYNRVNTVCMVSNECGLSGLE